MILSDGDILRHIHSGRLEVTPLEGSAIQPSSIDLRLSNRFLVFDSSRHTHINVSRPPKDLMTLVIKDEGEPFILHPGEFVLGSTLEWVTLGPELAARIEGKSSVGRLGLQVHSTAGVIDPGFMGNITLELSNIAKIPLELDPGIFISQLTVFTMSSPAVRPYGSTGLNSRYQGQSGPTAARPPVDPSPPPDS